VFAAHDGLALVFYKDDVHTEKQTLFLHWDGSSWNVVHSRNMEGFNNELQSLSVVSPSDIWAVGYYMHDRSVMDPQSRTLILHWDGDQWAVVPSPNLGQHDDQLYAVSAVSANDIWAVGYYNNGPGSHDQTLVAHWDGSQWSALPSPNLGSHNNYLYSVAAVGTNDIWAVGFYFDDEGLHSQNMVLHWDGSDWSAVDTPSEGGIPHSDELKSIIAVAPDDLWAVGRSVSMDRTSYIRMQRYYDPCKQ
jgi:hypothetical protein